MEETVTLIRTKLQTFRMLHLAMVMADVVYGAVIVLITKYAPIPPTLTDIEFITQIEYALIVFVMLAIVGIRMARIKMLAAESILVKKESATQTSQESEDTPPYFANYLSSLFILWAMIETIIISGVILFLTTAELYESLALIAIGAFIKISHGPKYEELSDLAKRYNSGILHKG